jgi:hypothetical protein
MAEQHNSGYLRECCQRYAVTDVRGNVVEVNKAFAGIEDRSPAQIGNANPFE